MINSLPALEITANYGIGYNEVDAEHAAGRDKYTQYSDRGGRRHDHRPAHQHDPLTGLAGAVDTLISIVPGGADTAGAIDATILAALGTNGVLINIGRGSVDDQNALVEALRSGSIAAAGLSVFSNEPHVPAAMLELENLTLVPHVGSASMHTHTEMAALVAANLIS